MINITEEKRIQLSVNAAYDSVNIINELKSKEKLNEEEQDSLDRNIKHIHLMLLLDYFVAALTEYQLNELKAI